MTLSWMAAEAGPGVWFDVAVLEVSGTMVV